MVTMHLQASVSGDDVGADVIVEDSWTAAVLDRGGWTAVVEADSVVSSAHEPDVRGSTRSTPGEGKC